LQYYEGLLSEAKRNKEHQISEAADKAVSDKLEEMQLKLEKLIVEKKKVADVSILSHAYLSITTSCLHYYG
jgi:BRCA1-associated protein